MADKLDQILTVGSTLDWISPLIGLIQDFTNGPSYNFYVDRLAGYSVNDLTGILKRNGVYVWGDMIAEGMIIFTVRRAQARWADYLLRRAGVPVLNTPIANDNSFPKLTPKKSASPKSGWLEWLDWLDDL
ncbi:MAG: hypothetical protein FOGNACKC_04695 [Anaerolineae bacterium]|nr:hypothetical protein [Anaerolineae bacterium]